MNALTREVLEAVQDRQRAQHHKNNEGIDTSVCYVVPKQLAEWAGLTRCYVNKLIRDGDIELVREGRGGSTALIHPEEAKRWLLSREKKEKH